MKTVLFALLLCLFLVPSTVNAKTPNNIWLNKHQVQVFKQSVEIGKQYGVGDLLPALVFRESTLGAHVVNASGSHFGPGQVEFQTAKAVGKMHPELGPITVQRLVHTDLGLRISAIYLRDCKRQFHSDQRALVCYNGGPGLAMSQPCSEYSRLVLKHAQQLMWYSVWNKMLVPDYRTQDQLKTKAVQKRLHRQVSDIFVQANNIWSTYVQHSG